MILGVCFGGSIAGSIWFNIIAIGIIGILEMIPKMIEALVTQPLSRHIFKVRYHEVVWAWQHIAIVGLSCVVGSLDRKNREIFLFHCDLMSLRNLKGNTDGEFCESTFILKFI